MLRLKSNKMFVFLFIKWGVPLQLSPSLQSCVFFVKQGDDSLQSHTWVHWFNWVSAIRWRWGILTPVGWHLPWRCTVNLTPHSLRMSGRIHFQNIPHAASLLSSFRLQQEVGFPMMSSLYASWVEPAWALTLWVYLCWWQMTTAAEQTSYTVCDIMFWFCIVFDKVNLSLS